MSISDNYEYSGKKNPGMSGFQVHTQNQPESGKI